MSGVAQAAGAAAARAKDRARRARSREAVRRAVAALRRRYPKVTQENVAARCRVDRSMVAKVWTGQATSAKVLAATYRAFAEAGWAPRAAPGWAREALNQHREES